MTCPVYLFAGPEVGEKNDEISKLRAQACKKYGTLDEYSFYTADTRVADVMSILLNESLFADARFIVLKGAEQIKKKEDIEMLSSWVKSSSKDSTSTLILVTDDNSCDKKLEALIPKENKRIFWEMYENRKEQWLFDFFKKNGYGITPDAVSMILDMVENNTESMRTECSRFFLCFPKPYTVTEDDVQKLLSHNREESAFSLFDSLCDVSKSPSSRLETALSILQKLRLSKESSGVQLIAGLTYCFRKLRSWHNLFIANPYPSDFDLKTHGFGFKNVQTQYRNASKIWNLSATTNILAALARSDMEIRTYGTIQEDTILNLLLYSIVIKKGMPVEEYQINK